MDIRSLVTNLVPILTAIGWLLAAYIVILWAASVLWTYRDILERSEDVLVQVLAIALALVLPFAGVILHLILRPRQTLADRYERQLEEEYLRRDMDERYACPQCQRSIETEYVLCPHCHTALRRRCNVCDKVIDLTWSVCPFCGDDGTHSLIHSTTIRRSSDQGQLELYER